MRTPLSLCVLLLSTVAMAQEAVPPPPLVTAPPPSLRYELKPNYALIFSGVGVFGDGLLQTAGFVLTVVGASLWHQIPVRTAHNGLVVTF